MARCKFTTGDECTVHRLSDRCYTDALPDRYCFAACPHDDGVYPDGALLRCLNCQVLVSLGPAASVDPDEFTLAIRLNEIAVMWEPGPERRWREEAAINFWAGEIPAHEGGE